MVSPCNGHLSSRQFDGRQGHHGGEGFGICSKDKKGNVLQQVADADCRNENRKG